jgi:hypothetical protein
MERGPRDACAVGPAIPSLLSLLSFSFALVNEKHTAVVDGNAESSKLNELRAEVKRLKLQLRHQTGTVSNNAGSSASSSMDVKYKRLITTLNLYIGCGTAH